MIHARTLMGDDNFDSLQFHRGFRRGFYVGIAITFTLFSALYILFVVLAGKP